MRGGASVAGRVGACSVVGVDPGCFAPVSKSSQVIGQVTEEASRATGIPVGTPVVAGGGDFPVSMLGFGGMSMKWCQDLIASARGWEVPFDDLVEQAGQVPAAEAVRRREVYTKVEPSVAETEQYAKSLAEFTRIYEHMLGFWPPED